VTNKQRCIVEYLDAVQAQVAELKRLQADEAILTTDTDVLTHLAHRFPSLEEGEIDAVVAELRRLLQEAFADAKEANPDKRTIRLTLR